MAEISIGSLQLDLNNFRHGTQKSQIDAMKAIIEDQGKKLVQLAQDIVKHGLNPSDLPIVIDAEDGRNSFIVVEGNRRTAAIKLMLVPEQCAGTPVHRGILKLHKEHADAIPKVITCVVAQSRKEARVWIDRKHKSGLAGAGTEHWTAMAKARADVDGGERRTDLDAVNFVLTNTRIDSALRTHLEGSDFNLTTLARLIEAKAFQDAAGFQIEDKQLITSTDNDWLKNLFTTLVTTIFEGKYAFGSKKGTKFTERKIDSDELKQEFVAELVAAHPGKKKSPKKWAISGTPTPASAPKKPPKEQGGKKATETTEERKNLVPRKFRLELPPGKICNIFDELKKLDAMSHRYAVSVLFRVFIELSVDSLLESVGKMPAKGKHDRLIDKIRAVLKIMGDQAWMTEKELIPIQVEIGKSESMISTSTLNAYVHNKGMNPDPGSLKISWDNLQIFIERIWQNAKK